MRSLLFFFPLLVLFPLLRPLPNFLSHLFPPIVFEIFPVNFAVLFFFFLSYFHLAAVKREPLVMVHAQRQPHSSQHVLSRAGNEYGVAEQPRNTARAKCEFATFVGSAHVPVSVSSRDWNASWNAFRDHRAVVR